MSPCMSTGTCEIHIKVKLKYCNTNSVKLQQIIYQIAIKTRQPLPQCHKSEPKGGDNRMVHTSRRCCCQHWPPGDSASSPADNWPRLPLPLHHPLHRDSAIQGSLISKRQFPPETLHKMSFHQLWNFVSTITFFIFTFQFSLFTFTIFFIFRSTFCI